MPPNATVENVLVRLMWARHLSFGILCTPPEFKCNAMTTKRSTCMPTYEVYRSHWQQTGTAPLWCKTTTCQSYASFTLSEQTCIEWTLPPSPSLTKRQLVTCYGCSFQCSLTTRNMSHWHLPVFLRETDPMKQVHSSSRRKKRNMIQ